MPIIKRRAKETGHPHTVDYTMGPDEEPDERSTRSCLISFIGNAKGKTGLCCWESEQWWDR